MFTGYAIALTWPASAAETCWRSTNNMFGLFLLNATFPLRCQADAADGVRETR
jgi:hypothetical protein